MSAATPAKQKKAAKPKKPAAHPPFSDMIVKAVKTLKDRKGSSRQAIVKYITANYKVGDNAAVRIKIALKRMCASGVLKHAKPTEKGASGSFKMGDKAEKPKKVKKVKKATKPKAKKPKAKKPKAAGEKKPKAKKPKAAGEKKPKAKKPKSPKKPKAAKPKAAKKSPKKAAKPKAKAKKAAKK